MGAPGVRERNRAFGQAKPEPVRAHLIIERERCKGCGFCVAFCPTNALRMSEGFNRRGYHPPDPTEGKCLDCGFCELICPDFSIYSTVSSQREQ